MNYRISFPADFKNIPPLRDLVVHAARLQGFSEHQAEQLRSVVDELCNNAIEFGSQPTSEVILELHVNENAVKIACHDQGHGNKLKAEDILSQLNKTPDPNDKRGRGVRVIVKSFVDELSVSDNPHGGITVTAIMKKK
ncbi:MAG: ATP-binding protein [Candidatus Gracilibacteria bacterium]|nr:ATP-binding protein [bacterium]MDZ4217122.1 ATP-binding protein [Candidatus Gracilibacteria bacterium]